MQIRWETLAGAVLIAASILIVGRWDISAIGYGYAAGGGSQVSDTENETVYRLDRWSGRIDSCAPDTGAAATPAAIAAQLAQQGAFPVVCQRAKPR